MNNLKFAQALAGHQGLKMVSKPFTKKGKPSSFLKLLIPFLENERLRKQDIISRIMIGDTKTKEKTYHKYLWYLNTANIIKTIPRGDGFWKKGENFQEYMQFVLKHIMKDTDKREVFGDFLVEYESNTIDFMMKS